MKKEKLSQKDVILIGFMGTGKTVVGALLAQRLKRTFIDTDEEIIKICHKSIPDIFYHHGEGYFRKKEQKVIERLKLYLPGTLVVSTGGGAVLNEVNGKLLKERGIVVLLTAKPDEILQRVAGDGRPLLKHPRPLERVKEMLKQRERFYTGLSELTVQTSGRAPGQVAEEILRAVEAKGDEENKE